MNFDHPPSRRSVRTRVLPALFLGISGALLAADCAHRDRDAAGVTSTTSAELPLDERDPSKLGHGADPRPVSTAPATLDTEANAVADALCARKYSCDEIGPNRPFVTREECMAEAIRDARRSLSTMACPHGTMERQTTSCLEAVRAEACSPVLDVTTGIGACQPEVICAP